MSAPRSPVAIERNNPNIRITREQLKAAPSGMDAMAAAWAEAAADRRVAEGAARLG